MKTVFFKNKSGVTMFLVLMFVIVASMLGSSLMYLSKKQTESGGGYFSKKTADDAAESALDWFVGSVEDYTTNNKTNIEQMILWIQTFDNSDETKRWFSSTANPSTPEYKNFKDNFCVANEDNASFIDIGSGKIKAKMRIENVDKANNIVVIQAKGYGSSDSKKTIRAVYKFEGLYLQEFIQVDSGSIPKYAFYSEGDLLPNKFTANGDVYIKGRIQANDSMIINGDLHVMDSSSTSSFSKFLKVSGNAYIAGNVKIGNEGATITSDNLSSYFWVNGTVEADGELDFNVDSYINEGYLKSSGVVYQKNGYIGSRIESWGNYDTVGIGGNSGGTIVSHGDSLIVNGLISTNNVSFVSDGGGIVISSRDTTAFRGAFSNSSAYKQETKEHKFTVEQATGVAKESQEKKTISVDADALITKKDFKASDLFLQTTGSGNWNAEVINQLYKGNSVSVGGKSYTWEHKAGDVLVIDGDIGDNNIGWEGVLDAGVKLSYVNSSGNQIKGFWGSTVKKNADGTINDSQSSQTLLTTSGTSSFGNGMVTTNGLFRGLVYTENGVNTFDNVDIYGSLIMKGNTGQMANGNGNFSATFDESAITDFIPLGVVKDPGGTTIEAQQSITTKPMNQSLVIIPKLISKY